MGFLRQISATCNSRSTILIRLMVGAVFLSEGVQKFHDPIKLGVGRFKNLGLPWPEVLAPTVGAFEIVCGALLLLGLLTRFAAVPLLVIILTAIVTTKLPMIANPKYGAWGAAHEARTDFAMLLGLLFLLIQGAGRWSIDRRLTGPGETTGRS